MHAVVLAEHELCWEQRPDPIPGSTELLVAVRAAGVNGADIAQRKGLYPAPPNSPQDIPGLEFAGEVVSIGSQVTLYSPGDKVMALVGGGAQATLVVVDESHALSIPKSVTWMEAGGFPEAYSTAYDALFLQANLSAGERLLITGAAGGVGTAAIQIASKSGACVVASIRDDALANRHLVNQLEALGADQVVCSNEIQDHGPYDVVLELVGASNLSNELRSLNTGGKIVVIGVGAGAKSEINLLEMMSKRARIMGSTIRSRSKTDKALLTNAVSKHVLPLLATRKIHVPISETFEMKDASAAYERFVAGSKLGKIILSV